MRQSIATTSAAIAVAAFLVSVLAGPADARPNNRAPVRHPVHSYMSCIDLAYARGYNHQRADYNSVLHFVYLCQKGRVPF
jgi:hypothetical protein